MAMTDLERIKIRMQVRSERLEILAGQIEQRMIVVRAALKRGDYLELAGYGSSFAAFDRYAGELSAMNEIVEEMEKRDNG